MGSRLGRYLKLGSGVADQYLFAGTNLIPSLAVARSSDIDGFALFSSFFLIYVLLLGAARASFSEPAAVRSLKENSFDSIDRTARALVWRSCTLVLPVLVVAMLGIAIWPTASDLRHSPLVWLGLIVSGFPFHALQDMARTMLVGSRRPLLPLISDLTWFAIAAVGFFPFGFPPVTWACLLWVLGGIVACLIVCPPLRAKGGGIRHLWSDDYSRSSLAEYMMQPAVVQGSVLLCGVAGSPSSVAALRGGTMLFRPIGLLLNTHRVLSFGTTDRRRRGPFSILWTGLAVSTLGTFLFAAAMWFLPDQVGHQLLGATWEVVHAALLPLAFAQVFGLAGYVFVTDLKAHRTVDGLGTIRLVGVVAIPLLTVLGAVLRGPTAAAWGLCAGQGLGLIWVAHRAAAMRRQPVRGAQQ